MICPEPNYDVYMENLRRRIGRLKSQLHDIERIYKDLSEDPALFNEFKQVWADLKKLGQE